MKFVQLFTAALCLMISTSLMAQKEVPNLSLKTMDGKTVNLQDYKSNGKITVVSFWATWCSPCKKELDAIADFYPDWQADYDVEVLAVTIDTRRALAKVPGIVETKGWEIHRISGERTGCTESLKLPDDPSNFLN